MYVGIYVLKVIKTAQFAVLLMENKCNGDVFNC